MHRIDTTLAAIGTLVIAVLGTAGCYGQITAGPVYFPPDTFLATAPPVYYDGRANYLYGGQWYYRDGHRWNHYRSEPATLRQHRVARPPARARPRPGARPAARPGPPHRR